MLSEITTRHSFQELDAKQSKIVHDTLQRQIQTYFQNRTIATSEGVCGLIEYIKNTHNVALQSAGIGSLEITFRCTYLESLESLWSDYQSGHLNDIAERYLVTDDIKKKLTVESIRLETTIEEENYRICKRILMEKSCKFGSCFYAIECLHFRLKQLKAEMKSKKSDQYHLLKTLTGCLFCCNPDYVAPCFSRNFHIFTTAILVHYCNDGQLIELELVVTS